MEGIDSAHGADGLDDGVGIGELPRLQLGIDFFSIDADLECPAAGWNQFQRANVLFEPQKLFRQTDGLWLIVSNAAIFDCNLQCHSFVIRKGYVTRKAPSRLTLELDGESKFVCHPFVA